MNFSISSKKNWIIGKKEGTDKRRLMSDVLAKEKA